MRRLIESGAVEGRNFVQVGLRGYWPPVDVFEWMQEHGLRWHLMREIEERGAEAVIDDAIAEALDGPDAIYLSVDIDVLDPGIAPGHRHARAGRPADARAAAGDPPDRRARSTLAGMDIVEVSPPYDHAEMTAMAAQPRAPSRRSARSPRKRAAPAERPLRAARRPLDAPARRSRRPAHGRMRPTVAAEPAADALARLYDLDLDRGPGRPRPLPRARRRGPAGRSSSSRRAAAGSRCRWPRPATTSPASTSTRRCSPGPRPPGADAGRRVRGARLRLVEADLLGLAARRAPAVPPRVPRPQLAVPARDPRRPAAGLPDDGRAPRARWSRRRRRLAARRRRPGPLRRPADPRVRPHRSETGRSGHEGCGGASTTRRRQSSP